MVLLLPETQEASDSSESQGWSTRVSRKGLHLIAFSSPLTTISVQMLKTFKFTEICPCVLFRPKSASLGGSLYRADEPHSVCVQSCSEVEESI